MNGIKANAKVRVEEDVDLVLKDIKLKISGQLHDEVLMMTVSHDIKTTKQMKTA